jgi:hypothetical protein
LRSKFRRRARRRLEVVIIKVMNIYVTRIIMKENNKIQRKKTKNNSYSTSRNFRAEGILMFPLQLLE